METCVLSCYILMNGTPLNALARRIYLPKFNKLERDIGYGLEFHDIPGTYINGWMRCNMTGTWKKFGLNIERGANYFTMGKVANGISSRFDRNSGQYQSWLGGYAIKLVSQAEWSVPDHFKLAIADQLNWLKLYGDPNPICTTTGADFRLLDRIRIGGYEGDLYEGGCNTHSDVGKGRNSLRLRLASLSMSAGFSLSNPEACLEGRALRPADNGSEYEPLRLKGYIAIFRLSEKTRVVLYANGTEHTFGSIKDDLLRGINFCSITRVGNGEGGI